MRVVQANSFLSSVCEIDIPIPSCRLESERSPPSEFLEEVRYIDLDMPLTLILVSV
jgi:hypothetical protein